MTEAPLVWSDLQGRAIEAWGFPSGTRDESAIVEAFTQHPTAVERALEKVLAAHKAGRVRAPWAVWRLECQSATTTNVSAPARDRGRDIERCLAWVERAGCYLPTRDELEAAVFDRGGALAWLAEDPTVRARVVQAWEAARPLALEAEAEAERAAAEWRREMDVQGRYLAVDGEAGVEARRRVAALRAELAAA